MTTRTSWLNLAQIDRATEATTKLVGEWIDDINDANFGNMRKIDEGFGNLSVRTTNLEDRASGNERNLQEHTDKVAWSDDGVHGIRHDGDNIEIFDPTDNSWKQISFDLSAIQPDTFIVSMPMTTETYFTTWKLYKSEGGIFSPLDKWGFTNALLTRMPIKPVMDFNSNLISIFSITEFEGFDWAIQELHDGVFIITAAETDVALVLVRKTSSLFVVDSQAAMLALGSRGVSVGNIAIRTDITGQSNQFKLTALPASTLTNWVQISLSEDAVTSVNGQIGDVSLDASDIVNPGTHRAVSVELSENAIALDRLNENFQYLNQKDASDIINPSTDRTVSAELDENAIALQTTNRLYANHEPGADLTVKFASEIASFGNPWAWIQSRIRAGNFFGINVGDFIPFEVAGNMMLAEVAGINTYTGSGGTGTAVPNHIDFISRDCWPTTVRWNLVSNNNSVDNTTSPWNTSNIYAFLNSLQMDVPNSATANPEMITVDYRDTGIFGQLPASLQDVIISKRASMPIRFGAGILLVDDNSFQWHDIGKLWVPSDMEVSGRHGQGSLLSTTFSGFVQYPVFANSMKYIKGMSHNSPWSSAWWTCTPASGNSVGVALVGNSGIFQHSHTLNHHSVPLCFRIA